MPSKDIEKRREASRLHYKNNRSEQIVRVAKNSRRYRIRNRQYVLEYLLKNPCVDCGEKDPIVLDFDHVRGIKKSNISDMIDDPAGLKTIQEEIDKCDVRCANCHRRITYKRRVNALRSAWK